MTKNTQQKDILAGLQSRLIEELAQYENEISEQKTNLTEQHERYLRMLVLLIKSLETLRRIGEEQWGTPADQEIKLEQLNEIQRRLARIAETGYSEQVSVNADR